MIRLLTLPILFLSLFFLTSCTYNQEVNLVILHTNDTHSQVEPTRKNFGGYARRMGMIQKIRETEKHVLLLDAGDFMQGTPYFNFFKGRVEIDAYNRMKYDAITLGNHEFDNGLDTLAVVLNENKIPIVCSNYHFSETPLANMTNPFLVVTRGKLRIGIIGLGPNPEGLIPERFYRGMKYSDPVTVADSLSTMLKKKMKCDIVVCLSHLGLDETKNDITDYLLAQNTQHIDIILGGHSHHIVINTSHPNRIGKPVIVAQMGKSGELLGRIDLKIIKQ